MGKYSDPIQSLLLAPVGYLPSQIFGDALASVEDQIDRFVLFPKRKNAREYVTLKAETAFRLGVQLVEVRSRRLRKRAKNLVHLPPGEPLKRWNRIKTERPWEEGQDPIQFPEQKKRTTPYWIEFLPQEPTEEPEAQPQAAPETKPLLSISEVRDKLWAPSVNGLAGGLDHKPQTTPSSDEKLQRLLKEANEARIRREARKRKRSKSRSQRPKSHR